MIHCFYHNDMDGHCAGAIVKTKYPDAIMHEINYGYDFNKEVIVPIEETLPDTELGIYIVDFSFTPEEMMRLVQEYYATIHWVDHHATAIERYWDYFNKEVKPESILGTQDTTKAGAQLTWEYIYPHTAVPLAVYYVSKYDIWDHADPRTIPFQRGLLLTETTDPVNDQAMQMWQALFLNDRTGDNRKWNALDQVLNIGTIGEAMKAQYDAKISKNAYYIDDWQGYRTVALNSYVMDSYCIFEHSDKWEEFDPEVLVWYYQAPKGNWIYSLRSYPGTDTDVSAIAKKFDGGGHKGAAGFTSNDLLIKPDTKE